jgi:hypothetical protein
MRLGLLCVVFNACGPAPEKITDETGCNGHVELCDRPLDMVTLAGTHNAMSNADAGWLSPNQSHGITRQLEDGIRAVMLDTMLWEGEPYLCHSYCELGAQPLEEGLTEIAVFMDSHPSEVVLIIFQDGISASLTTTAIANVGLAERAWTWDGKSAPLPTLGTLIADGKTLIVTAEHEGPPPDWYHHAWTLLTDTPYDFWNAEDFECTAARGNTESPLFLVNHWLSTPLPTLDDAASVNTESTLWKRATACETERKRRINILAVNFYSEGDLFKVVRELNGF